MVDFTAKECPFHTCSDTKEESDGVIFGIDAELSAVQVCSCLPLQCDGNPKCGVL